MQDFLKFLKNEKKPCAKSAVDCLHEKRYQITISNHIKNRHYVPQKVKKSINLSTILQIDNETISTGNFMIRIQSGLTTGSEFFPCFSHIV